MVSYISLAQLYKQCCGFRCSSIITDSGSQSDKSLLATIEGEECNILFKYGSSFTSFSIVKPGIARGQHKGKAFKWIFTS